MFYADVYCFSVVASAAPTPPPMLLVMAFLGARQAGHAFCLALTSEGEVLGWGRNDQGQLGLGGGLTMVRALLS